MILQTVISISSMIIQNCLFGTIAIRGKISLYTVISGLIFGVVTALSNFYKKSLEWSL